MLFNTVFAARARSFLGSDAEMLPVISLDLLMDHGRDMWENGTGAAVSVAGDEVFSRP
jgi:hypothetical protein